MLTPGYKNSFKKDLKLIKKRGKEIKKLYDVITDLISQNPLAKKYVDHALKGEYSDCRECHIEPDWLLIYLIKGKNITFIRTGTHSDLFR
ncbi:MAG TPA: type II toxin-antitoxin system YafQ family toxin [Gammaproteobacteria bacterium]|nr:type II toxin-antitoxin system YafQ family toxin [Gammaproteobacteria bacterium]